MLQQLLDHRQVEDEIVVALKAHRVSGAAEPVYLLPASAFGRLPTWNIWLDWLPWLLVCLGTAMVIFNILAWAKRYWRLAGRIHYTFLTSAALLLMWILVYWNIL